MWPPIGASTPTATAARTGRCWRWPTSAGTAAAGSPDPGSAARCIRHAESAMKPTHDTLLERLDRLLPQTQCGQCGFDGCRPYAAALARGAAQVDRCPPGGDAGA
ncbi:RnfABCDGE type electron transport complex subunit B, partial [Xanthomonas graminis]|uniref:RnfABCDGE type electron transport complex subunit B n=1 Tax=Xanthomonas graminis TaxID=3390026 RepID=UPI002014D0DD